MATAARRESGEASTSSTSESGYSGRLLLRMPRALHAQLAQLAEREGVSLNQLIIGTLARSVEAPADAPDAPSPRRPEPRLLTVALAVNLVVIVVAGVVAVALLIAAWRGGF
jgi:hypothetical protein